MESNIYLKRNFLYCALALMMSIFFSCVATKPIIKVKVLKPAELDLGGVKKLGILDFQGPQGAMIAARFSSKIFDTKRFQIIERGELQRILEEHKLSLSGLTEESSMAQITGKIKGVDAIVLGAVDAYECTEKTGTTTVDRRKAVGTKVEHDSEGRPYEVEIYKNVPVTLPFVLREGKVSVTYKIVDVQTGQLLATRSDTKTFKGEVIIEEDRTSKYLPSEDKILDDLLNHVLDSFVVQIAPYYVLEYRTFERIGKLTNVAYKYLNAGLIKEAKENLEQVISIARIDSRQKKHLPALYYNLGLVYEMQGEFAEAEQMYKKASIENPNEFYLNALSAIRKSIENKEKLENQQKKNKN